MKGQIRNKPHSITEKAEVFTPYTKGAAKWFYETYFSASEIEFKQIKEAFIRDFNEAMKTNGLIQLRK